MDEDFDQIKIPNLVPINELVKAIHSNNSVEINRLCRDNPNLCNTRYNQLSPVSIACYHNNPDALEALLTNGSRINDEEINLLRIVTGCNPRSIRILRLLINHGIVIDGDTKKALIDNCPDTSVANMIKYTL